MNKQLELALEWIEAQPEPRMIDALSAIQTIREALAELEQEPVAWMTASTGDLHTIRSHRVFEAGDVPLYAAPPVGKPLTDEQISELRQKTQHIDFVSLRVFGIIARAIERAHGIGGGQ